MQGVTFINTLRHNWRGMLGWGIGLSFLAILIMSVVQSPDALDQYAQLAESLPPALMQIFGTQDAALLATPEGFVAFGFFTYGGIILAFYGVTIGLTITATDEDDGIMDILLAQPIQRWQIVLERFAAHIVLTIGVVLISFIGLLFSAISSPLEIDNGVLFVGTLNLLPITLFVMGFTAAISVLVRRKSVATAIVTVFVVASYFIDFLLGEVGADAVVSNLRGISFFSYFDAQGTVANGIIWSDVAVLTAGTLICLIATVWLFERRDVGI